MNWRKLWINKSDYIYEFYKSIKGKYEIVDESIDYYMAMLEFGIYYLKDYSTYYDYAYKQHIIILDNSFFDNNYFCEDIKERDFAEYIKYLYFCKKCGVEDIYKFVRDYGKNFNSYLIIARLLFPSYYFYYFERVVLYDKDYDILVDIVNKTDEYEEFIKNIALEFNNFLQKKIVLPF